MLTTLVKLNFVSVKKLREDVQMISTCISVSEAQNKGGVLFKYCKLSLAQTASTMQQNDAINVLPELDDHISEVCNKTFTIVNKHLQEGRQLLCECDELHQQMVIKEKKLDDAYAQYWLPQQAELERLKQIVLTFMDLPTRSRIDYEKVLKDA